jgi:hypothetical protein
MREREDSIAVIPLCFRLSSSIWTSHLQRMALDLMRFFDGFAFSCADEAATNNAIMGIKSGAVSADMLPHILFYSSQ